MKSFWLIERLLDTLSPKINSINKLAEFSLYNYFFEENSISKQIELTNFRLDKLCHVWQFGLSIQAKHLSPLHVSTLDNMVGLLCVLKVCHINFMFDFKSPDFCNNAYTIGNTLIQLHKICLIELDKLKPHLLENHSNCTIFLKIITYIIRFTSLFYYSQNFFLPDQKKNMSCLIRDILEHLDMHKSVATCVWQWAFRDNLLKCLHLDTSSKYFYDDWVVVSCVKLLIECGLDPDRPSGNTSSTCLNTFVFNRFVRTKKQCDYIILLLLRHCARMDHVTSDKYYEKYDCDLSNLIKQPLRHIPLPQRRMASNEIVQKNLKRRKILGAKLS